MKVTGITAEYDPFHRGHLYQLRRAGELTGADGLVVVLGGDFLQRGTPCAVPKALRAKAAAEAGADLVIQLPYIYSVNSSSEYTRGAVSILEGIGCADSISFGCETDDAGLLERASEASEDENLSSCIKENLGEGMSYAEALTRSAEKFYGSEISDVLRRPNNLLACGYLAALREKKSGIRPVPVLRKETGEDGAAEYASASYIRGLLSSGEIGKALELVPKASADVLRELFSDGGSAASYFETADRNMLNLLKYRVMTADRSELADIYSVTEGIEARVIEAAQRCGDGTLDDFTDAVKTKRYTRSRISRMLVHMLMNFHAGDFAYLKGVSYARVLAFSEKGRQILAHMKKTSDIPVISNLAGLSKYGGRVRKSIQLDIRAAGIYNMIHGGTDITGGEYRYVPYISRRTE
ncbi:MAG: nucleotidyltransferase family protein [Anaerovoracaceae bacterium]|jgi:predicted nucleotidyltransferase